MNQYFLFRLPLSMQMFEKLCKKKAKLWKCRKIYSKICQNYPKFASVTFWDPGHRIFFTRIRTLPPLLENYTTLKLSSNYFPGISHILVKSTRQISRLCFLLLRTFSPGLENTDLLKCISDNFPVMLTHMIFLEVCWKNNSMYHFSPIQGPRS